MTCTAGGCRPDVRFDGKKITWGNSDLALSVADLDLTGPTPKTTGQHHVIESQDPIFVYHVDWSPDGRYLAFARGPKLEGKPSHGIRDGWAPALTSTDAPGWTSAWPIPTRKTAGGAHVRRGLEQGAGLGGGEIECGMRNAEIHFLEGTRLWPSPEYDHA